MVHAHGSNVIVFFVALASHNADRMELLTLHVGENGNYLPTDSKSDAQTVPGVGREPFRDLR